MSEVPVSAALCPNVWRAVLCGHLSVMFRGVSVYDYDAGHKPGCESNAVVFVPFGYPMRYLARVCTSSVEATFYSRVLLPIDGEHRVPNLGEVDRSPERR